MNNSEPDRSNEKVDLYLLSQIFPKVAHFVSLCGSRRNYTRSNAVFGVIRQLLIAVIVATIWTTALALLPEALLDRRFVASFGLALMLVILNALNQSFDLFYLMITGDRFDVAGGELRPVKFVMLPLGFVFFLFLGGCGFNALLQHREALRERQELHARQKEYFEHLDKGREAWNEYITTGPMHRIDFSGTDLSKRTFKGFFFCSVIFDRCNLTDTVFEDCYLGHTSFNEAICHRTSFKDSYLRRIDLRDADMTGADLTGAAGDRIDFSGAKIDVTELNKLKKPEHSRWHGVSWFDFRSEEWLRDKGYFVGRKSKGLKF